MRKIYLVGVLTSMILLSGCVSGPTGTPTPTTTSTTTSQTGATTVNIQNFNFVPQVITVPKGTTVTWTNRDSVPHTVTSTTGAFDSGSISPEKTYSHTFDTPGTYEYSCTIHPSIPHGKVVVTQ